MSQLQTWFAPLATYSFGRECLAGREELDAGERRVRRGTRIGFLEQEPRLDETKEVYEYLFPRRRHLADRLMAAMHAWVRVRQNDPSGVDARSLQDFAEWVSHRDELAQQTASVGSGVR